MTPHEPSRTIDDSGEMLRLHAGLALRYPLVHHVVECGERSWQITAIEDEDALIGAAVGLDYFPYGLLLWESAIALGRRLASRPAMVAGRRILELGCGVGLPGLVAAACGGNVTQTDHQAAALSLARWNAWSNQVSGIELFVADWRSWNHAPQYDVVLGADILYERDMRFYLEDVFRRCLIPGGTLLLSDPGRPQSLEFAADLEKRGFEIDIETCPVHRIDNSAESLDVAILTARLRT